MKLADIIGREVVRLEGERLDVGELMMLGMSTGAWQRFERDVARGVALELGATSLDRKQVSARATAFRRARRLLSAAEFTAWLAARTLTLDDLSGVLGRALLRDLSAPDGVTEPEVTAEQLDDVMYAEAVCGGLLDDLAVAALARLAAAHRLGLSPDGTDAEAGRIGALVNDARAHPATGLATVGDPELERAAGRIVALEDALVRTRAELSTDQSLLRRRLRDHGLEWMRLSGNELVLGLAGAARESRLLVTEDRLPLDEVAELARTQVLRRSFYLEEVPSAARGELASLRAGEVAAPWEAGGRWHVFELHDKRAPSLDDPVLRERALDELLADTLRRHAAGRAERLDAF